MGLSYPLKESLDIPESIFLFVNSFIAFDHSEHNKMKIVSLCSLEGDVEKNYQDAKNRISEIEQALESEPKQFFDDLSPGSINLKSNMGEQGYKDAVSRLKERIIDGDIIQAVPSHRCERKIGVHPFNIYKQLRVLNPSRYMFYLDLEDFYLVGASPELLVKVTSGVVVNHPIAGTRKRGSTQEEDEKLARELLEDEKEKAEHIMLVDLGRNDINRVADPESTEVSSYMQIEKYSHVMHIVSQVTGRLRNECTPFSAFRSIFPAGTLSGAPKVKAMELIATIEGENRGVYGGAVGYFSFSGDIDTCIAIRTLGRCLLFITNSSSYSRQNCLSSSWRWNCVRFRSRCRIPRNSK